MDTIEFDDVEVIVFGHDFNRSLNNCRMTNVIGIYFGDDFN